MRLLFDQNVSPHLVRRLTDLYPGSSHVSFVGLERASDAEVYEYARANGFAIVTKDADFVDISDHGGIPPKILWLRLGNCTTDEVEDLIRRYQPAIDAFDADPNVEVLALG